ncbi:GntR family transcriptional regulator [Sphingomonas sp. AP4-R1]|uniref:GntR family transcriptional regulator n=1 Tax=Sphingomonas sp. AP4-R1 TaxID=2735134 RepID=UPI0014935BF8|nr:GntR family transcriptional regulator [Sphingomonas sp. AP4-R1]QJU59054.1 GntR family transcriptional regulator [Sphingomonas sp. AP4-R1]
MKSKDAAEAAAAPAEGEQKQPRKGDRHQEAVKLLRGMIIAGDLAPGEPLRELAFSEQFGMSRTPVREAFRTLAAEGLISLLPNRTVQVALLDEEAVAEVFLVLGALESLAARLACERITKDQLDILEELQEDLAHHFETGDRSRYLEANRLIHELIVEAAASPSLLMAWRLLLPRAERARHVTTRDHDRWGHAFEEHKHIYAALMKRDGATLRRLMEEHFANGAASIQREHRRARSEKRWEAFEGGPSKKTG